MRSPRATRRESAQPAPEGQFVVHAVEVSAVDMRAVLGAAADHQGLLVVLERTVSIDVLEIKRVTGGAHQDPT